MSIVRPHEPASSLNEKGPVGATAMPAKHKKTKRLSWTLGRKKARDEPYVADRNGESL